MTARRGEQQRCALRALAFDQAPQPALVFGADGLVQAANDAAERTLGQALAGLTRRQLRQGLDAAAVADLLDRAEADGAPVRAWDLMLSLPGQEPLPVDAAAAPLDGGALLLTLQLRGPIAAERAQAALDLNRVSHLGQTLAHEIKNPLAGIRGAAQLLRSGATAEDAPLAQLIVDEVDRVSRLLDRMEALSDPDPAEMGPVNIHMVLDRVRALAANGPAAGLTLKERFDPSLPPVLGDEDRLIQVFLNLVKNAAEAAHARKDGRGEVLVTTAFRHGMRLRRRSGQLTPTPLEIRVQDNGPGVSPTLRDHLFEPFVTSKPTGVGLGLALTAKLVAAHQGLIDFESEPGRTVFRVLLPIAPAAAGAIVSA